MTGISCRSSDRKKPKKYHKNRKIPKKTEKKTKKSRKIPKKTERYRKFQIWDWFFSVFLGCNPPPPLGCEKMFPLQYHIDLKFYLALKMESIMNSVAGYFKSSESPQLCGRNTDTFCFRSIRDRHPVTITKVLSVLLLW